MFWNGMCMWEYVCVYVHHNVCVSMYSCVLLKGKYIKKNYKVISRVFYLNKALYFESGQIDKFFYEKITL